MMEQTTLKLENQSVMKSLFLLAYDGILRNNKISSLHDHEFPSVIIVIMIMNVFSSVNGALVFSRQWTGCGTDPPPSIPRGRTCNVVP